MSGFETVGYKKAIDVYLMYSVNTSSISARENCEILGD